MPPGLVGARLTRPTQAWESDVVRADTVALGDRLADLLREEVALVFDPKQCKLPIGLR